MDQPSYPRIYVERTLAIVKPDIVDKAQEIEGIILRAGFTILQVCLKYNTIVRQGDVVFFSGTVV